MKFKKPEKLTTEEKKESRIIARGVLLGMTYFTLISGVITSLVFLIMYLINEYY